MADNRKYYYLKLKENFFDTDEIKILEAMPNGYLYSNLLLKLYLKSLKYNGALKFNDLIPYNEQMIATITNLNIDVVRSGLTVLSRMNLVEKLDDGVMYMLNIQQYIGKSSTEADRKRVYRRKIEQKKLKLDQGQMSDKCLDNLGTDSDKRSREREIEIELEKEIEIEREKEKNNMSLSPKDNLIEVCKFYEEAGFGTINLITQQKLDALIEMYSKQWVKDAIETSVMRGKYKLTYVEGILQNWKAEGRNIKKGVKKREDVERSAKKLEDEGLGFSV